MTPTFSIFTPTHDTTWLPDLYASLNAQTCGEWEWVLLPNNGATIPADIASDSRVRVLLAVEEAKIGALKRIATAACSGMWLVEVDHDDALAPVALQRIVDVIAKQEDIPDFIYSDYVNIKSDGTCEVYGKEWGWESYPYQIMDLELTAMRAFQPTPSSLREIFYAPNHVRVWRRDFYEKIGGHADMDVCDDHDLVCRSYIGGGRFVHIPEPLYFYRLRDDGGNTFLKRNAKIQKEQAEVCKRMTLPLIMEWCQREVLDKLDLGGLTGAPEGFLTVDLRHGANIQADIRDRLPFEDNSVGVVRAVDFLEHIPHCKDSTCQHGADGGLRCVVGVMNEIYRVLAPGGWLMSMTPSTDGRGAFQDPTHCSFWNPNSFWYYTRAQQAKYVPGITCRFRRADLYQDFPSPWHKEHNIPYVYANLVALKGQREPGLIEI